MAGTMTRKESLLLLIIISSVILFSLSLVFAASFGEAGGVGGATTEGDAGSIDETAPEAQPVNTAAQDAPGGGTDAWDTVTES